jgi:hypothetical protein
VFRYVIRRASGTELAQVGMFHETSKICEDNAHTASGVAESYDRLAEFLPLL